MDLGSSSVEGEKMQRLGRERESLGLGAFVNNRDARNAETGEEGRIPFLCSHIKDQHDILSSLEGPE